MIFKFVNYEQLTIVTATGYCTVKLFIKYKATYNAKLEFKFDESRFTVRPNRFMINELFNRLNIITAYLVKVNCKRSEKI